MQLQENTNSLKTNVKGKENSLEMDKESSNYNLELTIVGSNNKVIVGKGTILKKLAVEIKGSNNLIEIGEKCNLAGKIVANGDSQTISIDDKTTFGNATLLARDGRNIRIGKDCMFSTGVKVRTSDSHPILELETKKRVNDAEDVIIGDHVWVGADVVVLKGASLPNDSIIGANSVVTKKFEEEHSVIAGFPAKVIKTGVTWSRK